MKSDDISLSNGLYDHNLEVAAATTAWTGDCKQPLVYAVEQQAHNEQMEVANLGITKSFSKFIGSTGSAPAFAMATVKRKGGGQGGCGNG